MNSQLYLFTSKGGVGKTSVAMAFTKLLERRGKKILYHSFNPSPHSWPIKKLKIPHLHLDSRESAENYMASKLGHQRVARWILKAPLFSRLLDVLPGLSQLLFLGHIVEKLRKDPDLIIVLDGPSSGHAMTLLESSHNFKKILKTGLIVQDIDSIHRFLYEKEKALKIIILTHPSVMAIQEAQELSHKLRQLSISKSLSPSIVCNDVTAENQILKNSDHLLLPPFLQKKIRLESEALAKLKSENRENQSVIFPHYLSLAQEEVIHQMIPLTQGLQ